MATSQAFDANVLMKIAETLECPVCLNTIWKPPIYRCENDHVFCGECHGKLRREGKDCPVCRHGLPDKRAFAVEQIVSHLAKFRCKNGGCEFQAPLADLVESHKDVCQSRLVVCYICFGKVAIQELSTHLKEHRSCAGTILGNGPHKMSFVMKGKNHPVISCTHIEGTKSGASFVFFRLLFKGRYFFWVSHYQGKKETEGFEYTISILCGKKRDQGKTFRLVKHTGLCLPMDTSLDSIKQELSCLALKDSFIKNALGENNCYSCEVTVAKAKEDGNMAK